MPAFGYSALLWGLLIVGLPVLIHLINMLRHRRIRWAAMEFLLVSQRKNRTWVLLKQLLLLLMRMAAIAVIVMMIAQPTLRGDIGSVFGRTNTHHIVLLDDSFSMSDRWLGTDAFRQAKAVVAAIGKQAVDRKTEQTFTLLRFSQVGHSRYGTRPDFLEESVDTQFDERLGKLLGSLQPSETTAGPDKVIAAIDQLVGEEAVENRIVYLVSDFRARQWDEPTDLRKQLAQLEAGDVEIHLIDCVDATRPNLAITSLVPGPGIHAAGVPMELDVTVKNFGDATARDVRVWIELDGKAKLSVVVPEVEPGKEAAKQVLVRSFSTPGAHRIVARLSEDVANDFVKTDNSRYCVVDLPESVPVLLVDGDPSATDAGAVSDAVNPGGSIRTGIRPRVETPQFLNSYPLDEFAAITLLNVDSLDQPAVEALEEYVRAGGGVAFFMGERCRAKFYNDVLYRRGEGLFPIPMKGPADLKPPRDLEAPEMHVVRDHPIFPAYLENDLLKVLVERYYAVADRWVPGDEESGVKVIARLHNDDPLAVEKAFGDGRVVAFLTTAASKTDQYAGWNNWAVDRFSFPVTMVRLQGYLMKQSSDDRSGRVGSPVRLDLGSPEDYLPNVTFVPPQAGAEPIKRAAEATDGAHGVTLDLTDTSGIYEARLTTTQERTESRWFAVNVDASAEGDLKTLDGQALAERLQGLTYQFHTSAEFQQNGYQLGGYNLSDLFLYFLVIWLIAEQLLAWSATYHPPARQPLATSRAAGQGGAR